MLLVVSTTTSPCRPVKAATWLTVPRRSCNCSLIQDSPLAPPSGQRDDLQDDVGRRRGALRGADIDVEGREVERERARWRQLRLIADRVRSRRGDRREGGLR